MEDKRCWTRPELVKLVRRNPQEVVLGNCKGQEAVVGPGYEWEGCYNVPCVLCSSIGSS